MKCFGLIAVAILSAPGSIRGVVPRVDHYGDPLPAGAIARIGTIRLRNMGEISLVALSPDGKLLVTTADRRPLQVWNTATGAFIREIPLPLNEAEIGPRERPEPDGVLAMAFPSDSRSLYVVTDSGNLRVCDIADKTWGKTLARTETPKERRPLAGAWPSPDSTHFFYRRVDGKQTDLFAVGADKPAYRLDHDKYGWVRSITRDHRLLATRSKEGAAQVWDLTIDKVVSTLKPTDGELYDFGISPDGKTVVAVCGPMDDRRDRSRTAPKGTVLLGWDVATGKELFRTPKWEGHSVAHSPDGVSLISIVGDEIMIADAGSGKLLHRLKGHGARWIIGHAFSVDGKRLVTGGRDHTAIIWDLATGKKILDFESPRGPVDVLAFSPDGKTLFAGCADDHTGGLWDADTGKRRHWLVAADGKGNPLVAAFTPDGNHFAVGYGQSRATSTGKEWTARLWSLKDGKLVQEFPGHTDGVHQLAISHDGKQLATRDWGRKVRLWELGTGKLTRDIDWKIDNGPAALAFTKTDGLIGLSGDKTDSEVIDFNTGKAVSHSKGDSRPHSLTLSPDGRLAAVSFCSTARHVTLCDVVSGKEIRRLSEVRVGGLSSVILSPDGSTIAVTESNGGVDSDDAVHLYDVKTGDRQRTIRGHNGLIAGLAFSPDGKRLATGGWDSTALVWELAVRQ